MRQPITLYRCEVSDAPDYKVPKITPGDQCLVTIGDDRADVRINGDYAGSLIPPAFADLMPAHPSGLYEGEIVSEVSPLDKTFDIKLK
jgi:hypothetical protein